MAQVDPQYSEQTVETQTGAGPEYEYPTTEKDEPVPVVPPGDVEKATDDTPAPGEDAPDISDKDIEREIALEDEQAGRWSEDMAANEPGPGEVTATIPEDTERLPSDRG